MSANDSYSLAFPPVHSPTQTREPPSDEQPTLDEDVQFLSPTELSRVSTSPSLPIATTSPLEANPISTVAQDQATYVRPVSHRHSPQGVCQVVGDAVGQAVGYAAAAVLTPQTGMPLARVTGQVVSDLVSQQIDNRICTHFSATPDLLPSQIS